MKNEKIASAASGAPKMSPTSLEYSDQLVPNENSSTIPVATPITNTRPRIFTRKEESILYISSFFARCSVSSMTMMRVSPSVSGG